MHKRIFVAALAAVGFAVALGAADEKTDAGRFVGHWSGTWEGGGAGRFELILERGADGRLGGGVSVGTDQGDYTAKFKELAFDGESMNAKYDFPLDAQAEVALAGTFGAGTAEGSWALQPQGQGTAFAGGTWKVTKR